MFIINAPWIFRTGWAIIRPFIHPITQAKIKILAGEKYYLKELAKNGISMSQIPTLMGGEFEAIKIKDIIEETINSKGAGM